MALIVCITPKQASLGACYSGIAKVGVGIVALQSVGLERRNTKDRKTQFRTLIVCWSPGGPAIPGLCAIDILRLCIARQSQDCSRESRLTPLQSRKPTHTQGPRATYALGPKQCFSTLRVDPAAYEAVQHDLKSSDLWAIRHTVYGVYGLYDRW